jgi:hypothetical protein
MTSTNASVCRPTQRTLAHQMCDLEVDFIRLES